MEFPTTRSRSLLLFLLRIYFFNLLYESYTVPTSKEKVKKERFQKVLDKRYTIGYNGYMTNREFYNIQQDTVLIGPGAVLVKVLGHEMYVRGRPTQLAVTDLFNNPSGLCYYISRRSVIDGRYVVATEQQIKVANLIYSNP